MLLAAAIMGQERDQELETPPLRDFAPRNEEYYTIQGNAVKWTGGLYIKTEVSATVTAYNPTEAQTDSTPNIMANNQEVHEGAIACPRYLKFGTLVEIDNIIYTCTDRMHPKNDGLFDILMFGEQEAINWGRQEKIINIYQ